MTRWSPITREIRGSLIKRMAWPTTLSLTASNNDIVRLCHAPSLASTHAARHAQPVSVDSSPQRAQAAISSFCAFVVGTFFFGWLLGVVVVFKLWQLAHAPRWLVLSGIGSVSFLMAPILSGALFSRALGRLASRGWRGAPLGLIGLGVCGLVAGLLAL